MGPTGPKHTRKLVFEMLPNNAFAHTCKDSWGRRHAFMYFLYSCNPVPTDQWLDVAKVAPMSFPTVPITHFRLLLDHILEDFGDNNGVKRCSLFQLTFGI